jgi:methenyltetrahydromethanopterin cyclohydrolase
MKVPVVLPCELKEKIMIHLDTCAVRMIGEDTVPERTWQLKCHATIKEAIDNGNLIGLKWIIKSQGKTITKEDLKEAVILGAENNYPEIVEYLIKECGVDVTDVLLLCARDNHYNTFKHLVEECCANIYQYKQACLLLSAQRGYVKIVEYLVKKCGVNVNDALILCAMHGYTDAFTPLYI